MTLQTSTYFGLLAEFGATEIPLELIAEKYFGLSPAKAKSRAAMAQLPVPAYRMGTQKSGWLVSASDLADAIDRQRNQAAQLWEKVNH